MRQGIWHFLSIAVLAVGFSFLASSEGRGCGMNWTEPKSHFDGVDHQGHVHLIETLGHLELGRNLKLPIFLIFNSGNAMASPYVGPSFGIPLLESRVVAVDENTFKLDQPDGWFRLFWRDKKNAGILLGQGGWKGEIKGDLITVWADCGSKMVFSRGRIVELQLEGRKFDYVYSGKKVSEIREGGTVVLKVNADAHTGEISGLSYGGNQHIGFEWGQKPKLQTIGGRNLVIGLDRVLSKVLTADQTAKTFEFGVDALIQPTLTINGSQEVSWNSSTLLASKVGEWTYDINPGEGRFVNAAIARRSVGGVDEFWNHDEAKGEETTITAEGVKTVFTWFTSGNLAGKPRKLERISGGQVNKITRFSYDGEGYLLRRDFADNKTRTFDRLVVESLAGGDLAVNIEDNQGTRTWIYSKELKTWHLPR